MRTRISEEQKIAVTRQIEELITNISEKVDRAEECYNNGADETKIVMASNYVSRAKQRFLGFIDACYIFGALIDYELSIYGNNGFVKVSSWKFI